MSAVKVLFEFFTGPKKRKSFGADLHPVACAGITSGIGTIFLNLEAAKATDLHPIAIQQGFLHAIHKRVNDKGSLFERNIGLLGKILDQLALIHDISVIRYHPRILCRKPPGTEYWNLQNKTQVPDTGISFNVNIPEMQGE